MGDKLKILFVEDVSTDAELIWREIEKNKISFDRLLVDNKNDFLQGLKSFNPDLIISDYSLPQFDGLSALLLRNELTPSKPFILVTGSINEEVAVECMKAGADDYILKRNLSRLGPAVINSIKKANLIKDKLAADEALRKANERLKSIFKVAPTGIGVVKNRIIVEINPVISQMTGYSSEELIGSSSRILYPDQEEYDYVGFAKYKQISKDGRGTVETRWKTKDGSIVNVILASTYIDHEDVEKGVIFTALDITDWNIAKKELWKSEQRLQKAQSIAHVGNWELDLSTKKIWCSEEALRIYGFDLRDNEVSLDRVQKSPLPEYRLILNEALDRLLKYNEPYEAEFKIKRGIDGEIRSIHSKGELIHASDGEQVKLIGVIQDITDRKENEEELIRAKEKAEESDRLKTAFLHNISHEIRTPMNAIVGFSALLGEPGTDSTASKSYIDIIMKSSDHLLSIISDIIEISNIEASVIKITKNRVDLNIVFKSLYNQFLPIANENKIEFISVPALSGSDSLLLTDNTKLIQVISNLLNNAFKFTQQGKVSFGYTLKDQLLEFFVSDTGIGIPEEQTQRIFNRFFQIENYGSKLNEGTGLGLSICKAYVELLGGVIGVSSRLGYGSTFYFTIPYEKVDNAIINITPSKKEADYVFADKKTILVAEDIDSNFKLIKYYLAGANINIIRASNGQEAVEKVLSENKIDLILMDLKMPVMDGCNAIKIIRETNKKTPIIAQTAYADERDNAIEIGCNGFITKPFDKNSLLKTIIEYI